MGSAATGKFMVVEGQVMDSMKWQAHPLACEVSDIGHAVYDGADALMLGAATSIGINPVEVPPLPTSASPHLPCSPNAPDRRTSPPSLVCVGRELLNMLFRSPLAC